jgi:alpha-glucosidase
MVWDSHAPNGGFSTAKPWLPVPDGHRARAVDVQESVPGSVLARYRASLAFRKQHPALTVGTIQLLDAGKDQLAFIREAGNERLLCLFNFADAAADWRAPSGAGTVAPIDFPGLAAAVDGDRVSLPPLGVLVARLE